MKISNATLLSQWVKRVKFPNNQIKKEGKSMIYNVNVINHAKKRGQHKVVLEHGNKFEMLKAVYTTKNTQINRVRFGERWDGQQICFIWLIDNDDILVKLRQICGVNKFFNC